MTYQDLLETLQRLTPEQRQQPVCVWIAGEDEPEYIDIIDTDNNSDLGHICMYVSSEAP